MQSSNPGQAQVSAQTPPYKPGWFSRFTTGVREAVSAGVAAVGAFVGAVVRPIAGVVTGGLAVLGNGIRNVVGRVLGVVAGGLTFLGSMLTLHSVKSAWKTANAVDDYINLKSIFGKGKYLSQPSSFDAGFNFAAGYDVNVSGAYGARVAMDYMAINRGTNQVLTAASGFVKGVALMPFHAAAVCVGGFATGTYKHNLVVGVANVVHGAFRTIASPFRNAIKNVEDYNSLAAAKAAAAAAIPPRTEVRWQGRESIIESDFNAVNAATWLRYIPGTQSNRAYQAVTNPAPGLANQQQFQQQALAQEQIRQQRIAERTQQLQRNNQQPMGIPPQQQQQMQRNNQQPMGFPPQQQQQMQRNNQQPVGFPPQQRQQMQRNNRQPMGIPPQQQQQMQRNNQQPMGVPPQQQQQQSQLAPPSRQAATLSSQSTNGMLRQRLLDDSELDAPQQRPVLPLATRLQQQQQVHDYDAQRNWDDSPTSASPWGYQQPMQMGYSSPQMNASAYAQLRADDSPVSVSSVDQRMDYQQQQMRYQQQPVPVSSYYQPVEYAEQQMRYQQQQAPYQQMASSQQQVSAVQQANYQPSQPTWSDDRLSRAQRIANYTVAARQRIANAAAKAVQPTSRLDGEEKHSPLPSPQDSPRPAHQERQRPNLFVDTASANAHEDASLAAKGRGRMFAQPVNGQEQTKKQNAKRRDVTQEPANHGGKQKTATRGSGRGVIVGYNPDSAQSDSPVAQPVVKPKREVLLDSDRLRGGPRKKH
jgi:hypothetical protein